MRGSSEVKSMKEERDKLDIGESENQMEVLLVVVEIVNVCLEDISAE